MDYLKLSIGATGFLLVLVLIISGFNPETALPFIPLILFAGFSPYMIKRYFRYVKLKNMEASFPEFLRTISESQKSGITIPQAIINSTNVDYGELSKEVNKMAAQISWGIPLTRVLENLSKRVKGSDFLKRSVAIILESYRSGGDVAEVMESVAKSARMVKELESERKSKFNQQLLVMYAIYIIFLVIIVALNKILLPMFSLSSGQDVGGMAINMGSLDPTFYRQIFLHMIIIQAIFAGLIAGQVGEGSVVAGVKHSAIMLVIGSLTFLVFVPSQGVVINVESPYDIFSPGSLYTVEGFVMESDKTPLNGAEVTIDVGGTSYRTTTDNTGAFSREVVLPTERGNHKVVINVKSPDGKGKTDFEVSVG